MAQYNARFYYTVGLKWSVSVTDGNIIVLIKTLQCLMHVVTATDAEFPPV